MKIALCDALCDQPGQTSAVLGLFEAVSLQETSDDLVLCVLDMFRMICHRRLQPTTRTSSKLIGGLSRRASEVYHIIVHTCMHRDNIIMLTPY